MRRTQYVVHEEQRIFRIYRLLRERIEARAGERLSAVLRSEEFDAYLRLSRPVAGITAELEADDDRGGETDARIRFTVPASGTYLLIAEPAEPGGTGAFTLSLEATAPPTTAAPRPIRVGQTVTGELAETDAIQTDDDTYYDEFEEFFGLDIRPKS